MEICLFGGDFSSSSWEQMQLQPPSKLAIIWANPKSPAAPNPNLKACSLGSLHSNIHNRRCFTYKTHSIIIIIHSYKQKIGFLLSKVQFKFNLYLVLSYIGFDPKQPGNNIHRHHQQANQHTHQLHGTIDERDIKRKGSGRGKGNETIYGLLRTRVVVFFFFQV